MQESPLEEFDRDEVRRTERVLFDCVDIIASVDGIPLHVKILEFFIFLFLGRNEPMVVLGRNSQLKYFCVL